MPIIIFRPEAETDVDEAHSWYETKQPGLGQDFFRQLGTALAMIEQHPKMHPQVHDELRRGLIDRFPYQIIYLPTDQLITIYAVFHASRNPVEWKARRRT